MILEFLDHSLRALMAQPWLLALLIVAATFVLEDAATAAVGLLAAQGLIDPTLAVAALFVGTVVGDLGLYAVGRAAAHTGWARRLRARPLVMRAEQRLLAHAALAIAAARFVPGTRLPVYTASGFLAVPFARVAAIVLAVSAIWTPLLFWLTMRAGVAGAHLFGDAAAGMAVVAVLAMLVAPRLIARRAKSPPVTPLTREVGAC